MVSCLGVRVISEIANKDVTGTIAVYLWMMGVRTEDEPSQTWTFEDAKTTSTKAMVGINKFANDYIFIYTDPDKFDAAVNENAGEKVQDSAENCGCIAVSIGPSSSIGAMGFAVHKAGETFEKGLKDPSLVWMYRNMSADSDRTVHV